ncbi:MAG: Uma2 family endonuclease [Phormidium tanganyikae FI6-MK23]|jgi:Uma2 family endonuclease|nr:Uma2 family endonuclease [Phormidium tanganyikae FI6-MK23]
MTQVKPRFRTIEEYLDYDNGADTRYELVNGVLVEMPPESRLNQRIASFLFGAFVRLGISTDLLVIGIQIAITSRKVTARQPDFVVLSQECAIALEGVPAAIITAAMPSPSLVVEVISPGEPGTENYDRDYVEKPEEYAARGIREFWQVDPGRAVVTVLSLKDEAYRSREFRGDEVIVSPMFPNLQLTAEQILRADLII